MRRAPTDVLGGPRHRGGARGGRPARARRAGERGGRGEEGGTLILGDVGRASAFVIATPWKLQADELATVRLFKDNTPSVVYITNLAVRQDAFTLDVLEVPIYFSV
ncbi:hypothetical protein ZWY2020_046667 [Hordeum vulgare]|nr:hypothetical protein ZWY2020_046667 [Hordeum vulgare]